MSIIPDKSSQGQNLQDIIDSYNMELMRLHRQSQDSGNSGSAAQQNRTQNRGNSDKTADIRSSQGGTAPAKVPEKAPEKASVKASTAEASPQATAASQPDAVPVLSESEQAQWMRDLEDGLEELRKGLIELAKGQQELSDGLREWQEGMAWAVPAAAGTNKSNAANNAVMSRDESAAWMRELEDGMEELRRGLIELAKGQQALSEGMNDWREGMKDWQEGMNASSAGKHDSMGSSYNMPANPPQTYNTPIPEEFRRDMAETDTHGSDTHIMHGTHMHGTEDMPSEPPLNAPIQNIVTNPTGSGNLCVTVNAARQAVPIAGASVTVTLPIQDYELLYSLVSTDSSGRTPGIELPVYEDSLSEHIMPNADSDSYTPEYRTYRVRVQAAGFRMRDDLMAEIFDGLSSTLNVELEPLSGDNIMRQNSVTRENASMGEDR